MFLDGCACRGVGVGCMEDGFFKKNLSDQNKIFCKVMMYGCKLPDRTGAWLITFNFNFVASSINIVV